MTAPAELIKTGVVSAIVGSGITGISSSSVKPRKVAIRYDTDPSPVCLVILEEERPAGKTNMTDRVKFPVLVLLVRKGALAVARSDGWMEEARNTLWGLLYKQMLLGSDGIVRRCEYRADPPFDRKNWDEDDDVSAQLFTYTVEMDSPD